jgi:hypothetical protein
VKAVLVERRTERETDNGEVSSSSVLLVSVAFLLSFFHRSLSEWDINAFFQYSAQWKCFLPPEIIAFLNKNQQLSSSCIKQ